MNKPIKIILAFLAVVILAGGGFLLWKHYGPVNSFESCVARGYPTKGNPVTEYDAGNKMFFAMVGGGKAPDSTQPLIKVVDSFDNRTVTTTPDTSDQPAESTSTLPWYVHIFAGEIQPKAYFDTSDWAIYADDNIMFRYPKDFAMGTSTFVNYKNNKSFIISLVDTKNPPPQECEGDCIATGLIRVSYEKDIYNGLFENYYNPGVSILQNKNTIEIDGQKAYVIKGLNGTSYFNIRNTFVNGKMFIFESTDLNMESEKVVPEDHDGQVFETILTTVHFIHL